MVCRKRSWHGTDECEDSDDVLVRQFRKVRKSNSDLFNIHGVPPPAQNAITNRNVSSSQFLRLPPEIRGRIYYFVFGGSQIYVGQTNDKTEDRYAHRSKDNPNGRQHKAGKLYHDTSLEHQYKKYHYDTDTVVGSGTEIDLRVLRVCRQIFTEAALLPYKLNSFTFEHDEVRRTFERIVRPGKKLAQRKAVGKYEIMRRREF